MRFWVGVSAAFGAGTLIGIGVGTLLVEKKLKQEYDEATKAHWRVVQAVKIDAETPALTEEDLIHIRPREEGTTLEGGEVKVPETKVDEVHEITTLNVPQTTNPYHTAVRTTGTQGIYASYAELSEEDYQEEDGRAKEQITMVYSDGEPIFFMNGAELELTDAMDMVGSTIVDDMREAVREGTPLLWRRNNQTEVDYEVVFEQP